YDHTIDCPPLNNPMFNWSKIGIEGIKSGNKNLNTIDNIMQYNGHLGRSDMILKCDIEGSEWEMLEHMNVENLACFKQIVIELHFFDKIDDANFYETVYKAVSNLTEVHKVIHVHANNFGAYNIVGGVPVPSVIELTLFREEEGRIMVPSGELFPNYLDMPCNKDEADYYLGTFTFF
ncbi:FkbM family methyltransferase, partial [Methylobacterium sp. WL6]|uniref:FkbM family methyltransferase n=1 Tax=Methylobacterium sp. WL6 TaxID=2603901 RepID=UPI0011C865C1